MRDNKNITTQTRPTRTGKRKKNELKPWKLTVDTREQCAYEFKCIKPILPFIVQPGALETGDYSAEKYHDQIAIERKSLADAYQSFGNNRERFEAEMLRAAEFKYFAVIIEAEWSEILNSPPCFSQKMNPKSIVASCIAWSQRYGIHFFAVPGREFGEKLTHRILERWIRDREGT